MPIMPMGAGFFSLFLLLSAKGSNTAPTRAVWHGKAITADRKTFYLESRAQVHIRNHLPTTAVFREQMQTPPPAPRLPSSASLPHLFSVSQQCSFFSFLSSSLSVAFCPAGSTFVFKQTLLFPSCLSLKCAFTLFYPTLSC